MTLHVRNDWDRRVAAEVFAGDEYRLRPLAAAGPAVRTVVDVGAHIGGFTMTVKSLWPDARVIAVEPSTDAAELFALNTASLKDVHYFRAAIARRGGPTQVRLSNSSDDNFAARFTVEVVEELIAPPEVEVVEWCSAVDIGQLLAGFGSPPIDILKLDCEGAEAVILEELCEAEYLARIGYICGEWHHWPSVPRVQAALAATHRLELYQHDYPWGSFFAHPLGKP